MLTRGRWLRLSTSGLLLGCATTAGRHARSDRAPIFSEATARSVSAADLAADGWGETVLTALRRFRPQFLRSRGVVLVTIDGGSAMSLSILETMTVSSICDVRLLQASVSREYMALTSADGVLAGEVLYVRTRTSRRSCDER